MYIHCINIRERAMQTKVQKWGNSLAVRIPKSFADDLRLASGGTVEIKEVSGMLTISPVKKRKATLKDMLPGITKENLHTETDFGRTGKELL